MFRSCLFGTDCNSNTHAHTQIYVELYYRIIIFILKLTVLYLTELIFVFAENADTTCCAC